MLGVLEGLFGVDDPLLVAQGGEEPPLGLGFGKFPTATRQGQLTLAIEILQPLKVQPPKAPREDADGQEEVRPTRHPTGAIRGQATCGQDTMEVGVMVQLLAPGVQHDEAAHLRHMRQDRL